MDKRILSKKIDEAYAVRAKRLKLESQVRDLKEDETALSADVLKMLHEAKLDAATGQQGSAKIKRTPVPQLTDPDVFLKWASLKANRDVLSISVSTPAWRGRFTEGVKVPGVDTFMKETLSLTEA